MTQPSTVTNTGLGERYSAARWTLSNADPDHLPSESELLGIAERWRPYRSLAAAYLFDSEFG